MGYFYKRLKQGMLRVAPILTIEQMWRDTLQINMKTNMIRTVRTVGLALLVAGCAAFAHADDKTPANEKTTSGTIATLDAKEKMLKIQGVLFTKTFVLGDNCILAVGNNTDASLNEFRPGQKVTVAYRDTDGVLVADRVTQDRLFYTGEISAIDTQNHVMTVRHGAESKTFDLSDHCGVTLNAKSSGTLADVKPGNHVTVIYEKPAGRWVARWIEQPSQQFTGTLDAVDLDNRTLSAGKPLLGDKKFHIGDDCTVVINGKIAGTAHLKDIHTGANCELSYETVDGVNIVNRIGLITAPEKPETSAQTAGATTPPPVAGGY
jgi:Cu/Ag efflux protein CusF